MHTTPHPLHAMLLGGTVALFLGVLLNDIAYFMTYEIQWKNFAAWLLVGALFVGAMALLWALIERVRAHSRTMTATLYVVLLVIAWILGFINSFVHAGDAWASIPTAPTLSALAFVLAITAAILGFRRTHSRVEP